MVRALGRHVGLFNEDTAYAQGLSQTLGRLKGPVMKIGQILSTVPDMVPEEYAQAFAQLQSNAPAMGWLFVRRRMMAELGPAWQTHFKSFSQEATFAASLGQVHRAQLVTGDQVACKLQYPQMAQTLESDLRNLATVCSVYETFSGGLSTHSLQQELRDRLYEELDYGQEARHVQWFGQILAGEEGVRVPQVYPHLSTHRLLTLSWLEGQPFGWLEAQSEETRTCVAERLFRAWYTPLYTAGVLHGDPHLGNYTVSPEENMTLNLFDFGCVKRFEPQVVGAIVGLYKALLHNNWSQERQAFEDLGFRTQDEDVLQALHLWARFLYGPLLEDRVRPLDETFSGIPGKDIAATVHKLLRKGGGVAPPGAFVFLDRAAVGIGSAMIRLKVSLNWHALFEELIHGFSPLSLGDNQKRLGC